jgi:hypothetical protein
LEGCCDVLFQDFITEFALNYQNYIYNFCCVIVQLKPKDVGRDSTKKIVSDIEDRALLKDTSEIRVAQ